MTKVKIQSISLISFVFIGSMNLLAMDNGKPLFTLFLPNMPQSPEGSESEDVSVVEKLENIRRLHKENPNLSFVNLSLFAEAECEEPDLNIASVLLQKGADIHAVTREGWTPLTCAARVSAREIFIFFLKRGANIHHKDVHGQSIIRVAMQAECASPANIKFLVGQGCPFGKEEIFEAISIAVTYASWAKEAAKRGDDHDQAENQACSKKWYDLVEFLQKASGQ